MAQQRQFKATQRQKKAFKAAMENGGNISQAMITAGYSPNTAKTPQKLTESDAWKEFIEGTELETTLVQVAKEGLQAAKLSNSLTAPDVVIPDHDVRHKFWKSINEMKGRFPKNSTLLPSGEGVAVIAWKNNPES